MEGVRPRAAAELVASGQWVASLAKCAEGSGLDCWVEPKRTFLTRPTFKSHGRCLSLPFELDTKSTPALQRPLLQAEDDPWMAKQKDHCSICFCSFANQNHCKSILPSYMQKNKSPSRISAFVAFTIFFPLRLSCLFLVPLASLLPGHSLQIQSLHSPCRQISHISSLIPKSGICSEDFFWTMETQQIEKDYTAPFTKVSRLSDNYFKSKEADQRFSQ